MAQHPLRAEIESPEKKVHLGVHILESITFSFVDQSSPGLFSPNVGGVADDQELFRFLICSSVPETLAIKVESCRKSRKILGDFLADKFLGAGIVKIVPNLSPRASTEKSPVRILPLARKLLSLTG